MIKIIKKAKIYSPEFLGVKDVLLVGNKISHIEDNICIPKDWNIPIELLDGNNKILTPGFIDSHVHILGGGGEGGFKSRTPEITLSNITLGGVTTVVGCLGTDGITRSMTSLLAKARGLEEEGISTYIYSGSYRLPLTTVTGDIMKDIICIDKIIGAGEVALSDHRSSNPSMDELIKMISDVRVGGILSNKSGIINIHLGDGKNMLTPLLEIVENTEIPITQFLPTHTNRNPYLFENAIKYALRGGYIDFTTSSDPLFWEEGEVRACKALKISLDSNVPIDNITFSSDGQGSLPMFNDKKECIGLRVGSVISLFEEVRRSVLDYDLPLEIALKVITSNPAKILKLKNKGFIKSGYDADLVLINEETLTIDTVIAKGDILVHDKTPKCFGTFE